MVDSDNDFPDLDYNGPGLHTLKDAIDLNDLKEKGVTFEFSPDEDRLYEVNSEKAHIESSQIYENSRYDLLKESNDESSPFESLRREMKPIDKDKFVYKKEMAPGAGILVNPKSLVTFHVNLFTEYSDEPFDSSRLRDKPMRVRLDEDILIKGLEFGIKSMKKGEIAQFLIDSRCAYGVQGVPPRIPGGADIFAEVEIIYFVDSLLATDMETMSEEERREAPFKIVEREVKTLIITASDFFNQGKFFVALKKYIQAVRYLEFYHAKDELEDHKRTELLLKLYLNITFCHLKLADGRRAHSFARKVLNIDYRNVKGLYRCGKAHELLCEWKEARIMFRKALKIDPTDKGIQKALQDLEKKEMDHMDFEKNMYKKMF